MPRPPRVHYSGALFHVTSRGNGGQQIFFTDADRQKFLEIIGIVKKDRPFKLYAWCLMSNHYHLLIEVDLFPIWVIMQRIKLRYAKYFNIGRKRFGHVFQARYKGLLCEKRSYLLKLLQYIHLNPVEAHLCEQPEDWRWSSYRDYLHPERPSLIDPGFPLSLFSEDNVDRARERLIRFIRSGIRNLDEKDFNPPPGLLCLGGADFIAQYREKYVEKRAPRLLVSSAPLERVAAEVASESGVSIPELRSMSRRRNVSRAKRLFAARALERGNKTVQIAAFLRCSPSAISQLMGGSTATPKLVTVS